MFPSSNSKKIYFKLTFLLYLIIAISFIVDIYKKNKVDSIEININREGYNYREFDLPIIATAKICQRACKLDERCISWTYAKAGIQGSNNYCWLKDREPHGKFDSRGFYSGVVIR
jgi:hypothetical protein